MASTSSTPLRKINYDVFLSFRGTDTRKTFVDHLYNKLLEKGIRTFKDDEELEKGQRIEKLLQTIKESRFAVVVFSKDYASAKWCLEEIATIMECQQQYAQEIVIPIFYDVEPLVVRYQTESFGESFKRHEEKNTEKAKVERWKEALKKAGEISGYHLQNEFNGFEGKCVEKVTHDIFTRMNYSTQASSTVLKDNFVGLETRVGYVGKLLTLEPDDVKFIGIWGMGGIGKTTTARAVFKKFSSQFDGACFLADIRQHKIIELQRTLLETIQNVKMEIIDEFDGTEKIQRWLGTKKVLIVLDDVDHVEQLQNLAEYCNWFGRGSRVIITTRDAGVLRSHGIDEKHIYEVETLGNEEAIQLFSSFAFKKEAAPGVKELSGLIVRYAMGLPLALKVLGSYLCGLEAAEWKSTLEKLKDTPNDDIHGKLKISFDRLDPKNQKIFLHIACFFRREKEEYVKDVLESCDLHPVIGMRVLIERSLISVDVLGRIQMHDLIQDVGWHIARQEKPRSRVWEFEDAVLHREMELTVTKHIECISLPYNTYGLWLHNYENISSAFEALKILIVEGGWRKDKNFERDVKDNYELPSSLRWLHFPEYPFPSLPTSFHLSTMDSNPLELVRLCLRRSSLQNCWITKELNKLTYLDLSSSYSLVETPNFDMMPNLEKLYLSRCEKLIEIHPSVGRLEKLILLDLNSCDNLKKLPSFIQLSSLEFLKLDGCPLENFPEIQKSIPLVLELKLEPILITELPSSIRQLCGLTELRLIWCENLVSLSDDLCELKSLKILELRYCRKLESLPENLGNLSKLEELHISDTAIFQLPYSIAQLSSLECLCWGHKLGLGVRPLKFVRSVSSLCSLKRLRLNTINEGLPSDLGQCLISLEYLNLQGSNFGYLPESFSKLPLLQYLDIRDCKKLKELPQLPKATRELYVDSHFAIGNESINIDMLAIKNPMLYSVVISSCWGDHNSFKGETFLAKKSIQFPFHRKTPFSVSYHTHSSYYRIKEEYYTLLRSFKYRRYGSNRISFNLNHRWYSTQFVGIAVFFVSSEADKWGPHSYQGFDDFTRNHCVIKAKLSSHNDIKNEDLQTKCVIAGSTRYRIHYCFVYLPFSSLWPESKSMMGANDYSRFEVELVDLKASADWGINLLYKCPIGAREHMDNYHRSDSGLLTTNDIGCLTVLESEIEYLNYGSNNFVSLPACYSQLPSLQYLDISGRGELEELSELPTTIRELYANSNLASESNLVKLATKYPKLYSVSFSPGEKEVSAVELARKFAHHQPFQIMRDSSFIVTYPSDAYSTDSDVTTRFKYSSLRSNKISISLKSSWHNQRFVGFVVRFILNSSDDGIWKSCPDGRPFRYSEVIAQLVHKDNEQLLQTNCVIGRLCDEDVDVFMDRQIICFAYIPFLSLFKNKLRAIPSDYLVFEVAFGDPASNVSTDWSCGLLYKNDESLSEALWSKTIASSHDNGDSSEESNEEAPLLEETPVSTPEPGEPKFFPDGLMASTSSVTASQSIHEWTYDVFLNFRGSDIDKIFVDYLYTYLDWKGIHTFKDYDQMEEGDCVSLARLKAIKDSRFFITVFSKGYASSKCCLEELATIMECQEKFKEQIVVPIFYDVEPSDVRKQKGSFGDSFKELVEFVKDEEKEKVRRWKEVLKKTGYLKGHHLQKDYNRLDIKCVQGVAADIFARLNQSNQTWSAFENNLEGLKSRVNDIGNWLKSADDDDAAAARFICICGMGGIGKTTTAMAVFNKFSLQFDRAYFLPSISRHNIIELQKALLEAILEVKIGIRDEFAGMAMIRRRLRRKKVLIVLDDVVKVEQLEKLAGRRDWFGRGSRVIITTRDAGVLRRHGIYEKYIYKVDTLEEQEAIQLFSWYAFKKKFSTTEIEELCGSIVYHCKGLPLALKLLGSYLCGQEAVYWKSTLEKLNDTDTLHTPIDNILPVLRTSFDTLDCENKNIFLYIACFFRHEMEEYVKDVLINSYDLHPVSGMHVLSERSLISVVEGRIEMHDLIQHMGWHIAREEKRRSMVWEFEDAVLYRKMDPEHIECMVFPYTYRCDLDNDKNIWGAFKSLKILIGKRSSSNEEDNNFDRVMDKYLPSSLRWLHFPDYPFPSLPKSFHSSGMDNNPSQLAGVYLHSSSLENCRITKELTRLTYLNLSSSCSLLETPNFDMLPNLKELYLSGCEKLKEIHPSIGHLQELSILDLSNCRELEKLPCFVRVLSLRHLRLEYCGALQNFPEIQTTMEYVWELNLQSIWIKELPSSIQKLRGLTELRLINCGNLVHLSNALCELKRLQILGLTCCDRLESLPENLGNLSKLKELHVIHTAIFQLPSSITQLRSLECLCWGGNRKFKKERTLKFVLISSESSLCSLKRLQLSDFKIPDEGLPSDLGCLILLEYLNLRGSDFVDLPESFSQLPRLEYLDIRDCGKLKELPKLPQSTRELYADFHFASRKSIKELAECPELHSVAFSHDDQYHCPEHCLAKIFIHFPFHRKTHFSVSYPIYLREDEDHYTEANVLRLFQSQCYQSNGIAIDLNFPWYCQSFAGFAVYFRSSGYDTWRPPFSRDIDGVEYFTVKAKLSHKDERNEFLERECVIASSTNGYDNNGGHICFVYIPFSSLWPAEYYDFSRFEVNFKNLEATADWGCSLIYKREAGSSERDPEEVEEDGGSQHTEDNGGDDAMVAKNNNSGEEGESIDGDEDVEEHECNAGHSSGPDRTKLWELTEIVDQVQCQMVSMPECSNAKVARLLYTNSGASILALNSDGIQKLWKWSYNEQNPSRKNWQPNSGPPMINDVSGVNLEEVVPCIALSNDDSYVVSAVGGKVSLFNIMTSEVLKTITSLPSASTFLAFHPHDNNIIAIGTEKSSICIYDWENEELIELGEHRKPITGLAFSIKHKMLVSADADAQLCVWTTNLWKKRRSISIQLPGSEVPSGGETQVMFHADQPHLLVTHETQLAIYDASKMELIHQWIPCVRISSATYSCNSQLIYASFIDGNIGVLDADTLRLKCRIVPSAYLPQNGSEDVYPLVIAAHPQEPNQFAVGLTDGSIEVIEPLESQGNWEVSISSPVDNEKKNGRLVWQVLRGTLATVCLGLFGMGIIRSIQTKTRKSKMNFDGYMTDGSRTNRPHGTEKGEPNQP